ncbi:YihY family inner membrane protein [Alcaligenes ammonioxydans]|nr:YihY family inner membrane protein [Alcaligenes ammonioxydans]EJC65437.1 ribonuclease [Alcaligenes faecalis subsp. faecalis NCIB 8687]MCH1878285.1 YihY family inner membrane protein [Alcaligenes ammonioxydans]WGQ34257.1 YihY family inner membrane protein [Alcaligenes faecalis]HRK86755.1 YihY family inner membrane protein [Alcaligenes faecalis]
MPSEQAEPTDLNPDTTDPAVGQKPPPPTARHHFLNVLRFAIKRVAEKDLMKVASSLTYTTILAIVPLLTVVLALFTAFPLFQEFEHALEGFLTRNLMPEVVSENVMLYLNQFAAKASGLTAVGSLFLIVTSIMLIMTIDETFNNIFQVHVQRPLGQRLLVYWAIISLGPILTGASLWATTILARESMGYIGDLSGIVSFALAYVPFLFTALGLTALFMYVPNRRVWWRDALIGGVVTAALLELMKAGFAFYLTRFPTYTIIYGAFAILPIFLLWIYISWLIVLLGASMVAILPDWRGRNWVKTNVPGIAFTDAVNLLHQLWLNRQNPEGLSVRELSHTLERDPDELYNVLCQLKSMGLIADTQLNNDEQWVLSCDLRLVSLNQLITAFLLDRAHTHEGPLEYVFNYLSQFFDQRLSNLEALFESPQGILTEQPAIPNADPGQETQYAKSQ